MRLKSADAALATSDTSMKKRLTAADLILLGVGRVIGGGVFVLTAAAAHDHAGPAVVVSYVLASLTSMITGLCYTEFAVETPVAGSAYNFVSMSFGEFAGFLCGVTWRWNSPSPPPRWRAAGPATSRRCFTPPQTRSGYEWGPTGGDGERAAEASVELDLRGGGAHRARHGFARVRRERDGGSTRPSPPCRCW